MFRDSDIEAINLNIDKIKNDASMEYKKNYEPTMDESVKVYKIIQEYIIENKRIIYGGFAQHLLIKNKNPDDGVYTEIDGLCFNYPDIADMEFFSPEPLIDIVNLTNDLFNLGFKYVEAKEAVHGKTYKLFINMINYCDFAYMPTIIYNNMPIIQVEKYICCHPHFMLIDAYRIFNDPLTSYWRLEKPIKRFHKLLKYYPLISDTNIIKNFANKKDLSNSAVLKYIRKKFIHKKNLIVIGFHAYNYYVRKYKIPITHYEVISTNFKSDVKYIYKKLVKHFKNIKVVHYFPFYEFLDYSIEYYFNDQLILKVIDYNERCTVYRKSLKKKTYFGTNNLVLMHLLINYIYYYVYKLPQANFYLNLIKNLYNYKNNYLEEHKITVINKSLFQDFTLECLGKHVDVLRKSYIKGKIKKLERKPFKFTYIPDGNKKPIEYKFDNITGGKIKNDKYFIINY